MTAASTRTGRLRRRTPRPNDVGKEAEVSCSLVAHSREALKAIGAHGTLVGMPADSLPQRSETAGVQSLSLVVVWVYRRIHRKVRIDE